MRCPTVCLVFAVVSLFPATYTAWSAPPIGEFEIRVVDADTGEFLPVRMHLRDPRGRPVHPPQMPFWKDHFAVPGKVILQLRPGKYTFEMERGPEYRIRSGHFTITRGDADSHEVTMERFVDMKSEGWWSGDLHIHRPADEIEQLMQAEDLHVAPVITWWNERNAWAKKALPIRCWCTSTRTAGIT